MPRQGNGRGCQPEENSLRGPKIADVARSDRNGDSWSLGAAAGLTSELLAETWDSPNQARRVDKVLGRFVAFAAAGFGVSAPESVTAELAATFVHAAVAGGSAPSVPLMHLRRSALRLLFRALRQAGAEVGDPTLDLELPPRSQLSSRALADDEVMLCRGHALWALGDHRRAAAWALAEATCRSVEIAHVRRRDVDLTAGRVWIHGGRTTAPRWGSLTDWGASRLELRLRSLHGDPDVRVVYGGAGSADTGQVSACVAIVDVLRRAGLAVEPDVRPASIVAWAGQRILGETGRIDEVARGLGMGSLDRTARLIAFDWMPQTR